MRIKQLEWEGEESQVSPGYTCYCVKEADDFSLYHIEVFVNVKPYEESEELINRIVCDGEDFENLEDAKAWCQADFEKRVSKFLED
jgi:hypothetical protein